MRMRSGIYSCAMAEQEISPAFHPSSLSRDELVVYYSLRGLRIREIQMFLQEVHGYCIRLLANSVLFYYS